MQGGIRFWGKTDRVQVYDNTIVLSKPVERGTPSCVNFEIGNNRRAVFLNNIFRTLPGVAVVRANGSRSGEYNATRVDASCKFLAEPFIGPVAAQVWRSSQAQGGRRRSSGAGVVAGLLGRQRDFQRLCILVEFQLAGRTKERNLRYGVNAVGRLGQGRGCEACLRPANPGQWRQSVVPLVVKRMSLAEYAKSS